MLRTLTVLTVAALLGACAGPRISQIDSDKNLYTISQYGSWSEESGAAVKLEVYKRCGTYCEELGQNCIPMRDTYRDKPGYFSRAHAELQFRCVDDTDQQLIRPVFKPAAKPDSNQ